MKRTILGILSCVFLLSVGNVYAIGVVELADRVAKETGLPKKEAQKNINSVFEAIKYELAMGESVTIKNFGRFSVKERGPRKARNPKTGESIQVEARNYPRFSASDNFKKALNKN